MKLKEAADFLMKNNVELNYANDDAIGFMSYDINEELFVFNSLSHFEYVEQNLINWEEERKWFREDDDYKNMDDDELDEIITESISDRVVDFNIRGRIWLDEKVIGFWFIPDFEEMIIIIERLNKRLNINIDGDWKIHLTDNKFVKLSEYSDDLITPTIIQKNKELEILHLMDYKEKKKALLKKGYKFKRKSNNLIDVKFKDYSTRYKYTENKLNENPDVTIYNDIELKFTQNDTLSFNLIEDEIRISLDTHGVIGGRDEKYYSGRLWFKHKIISFWFFPDEKTFKLILEKIKNYFKNDIFEIFKKEIKRLLDILFNYHNTGDIYDEYFKDWKGEKDTLDNVIYRLYDEYSTNKDVQYYIDKLEKINDKLQYIFNFKGFDDWKVEIYDKDFVEEFYDENTKYRAKFIPVNQYIGSDERDYEEVNRPHLMDYEDKKKHLSKSRKSNWKKWQKPFENKINENMDLNTYFDEIQEYIKLKLKDDDILPVIRDVENNNVQAVVNQCYNNNETIEECGDKVIDLIGGRIHDHEDPDMLKGDRALNTLESKILRFKDFK